MGNTDYTLYTYFSILRNCTFLFGNCFLKAPLSLTHEHVAAKPKPIGILSECLSRGTNHWRAERDVKTSCAVFLLVDCSCNPFKVSFKNSGASHQQRNTVVIISGIFYV